MRKYIAGISCKDAKGGPPPTHVLTIEAESFQQATNKALAKARQMWQGPEYSVHTASVAEVDGYYVDMEKN